MTRKQLGDKVLVASDATIYINKVKIDEFFHSFFCLDQQNGWERNIHWRRNFRKFLEQKWKENLKVLNKNENHSYFDLKNYSVFPDLYFYCTFTFRFGCFRLLKF